MARGDAWRREKTQCCTVRRTNVLMRRLRDNDMLEAEMTLDGDMLVEGQRVGRLSALCFTHDAGAATLPEAAQSVLRAELERRIERLSLAPDTDIILSTDGTLRWLGEPVARLIPGDSLLHPRLHVLVEETLPQPFRMVAEARLDLWLSTYVEKRLGPLLAMEKAEDLTGLARDIAHRIIDAMGVLERATVAESVKQLDQEGRTQLRAYGVRFGAYHLYVPALLKPAPRALAAQLWALSRKDEEIKGLDDMPPLASAGRTSFAVPAETSKDLARMLGYRLCGARAVRVDILERLADLIRPAIAFRPGITPGDAPEGAAEGNGFIATVAMTSLLGCAGEDFSAILSSLGYRAEQKTVPAPAAPAAEADVSAPAGEQPVVEDQPSAPAEVAPEALAEPAETAAPDMITVEVWRPVRPERPAASARDKRPARTNRPPQEGEAKEGRGKPRHGHSHRGDKKGGDRRSERPAHAKPRQDRKPERQPDPNSPFAALLALKDKFKADAGTP